MYKEQLYQHSLAQPFSRQPIFVQTQYIAQQQQQIPKIPQKRSITPILHKPNAYTMSFTSRDDFTQKLKVNQISEESSFMRALIEENKQLKQQVETKRAELLRLKDEYNKCQ